MTDPFDNAPGTTTPLEISATLKAGTGFDAPWIVIRGGSFQAISDALDDELTKPVMEKTVAAGKHLASLQGPSAGGGGRPAATGGSATPQGAQEAPGGRKEFCAHGAMTYTTGISKKTGNPYKMFKCPSNDRATECPAVFVK